MFNIKPENSQNENDDENSEEKEEEKKIMYKKTEFSISMIKLA